jgi:transposase InsO family protein
MENSITQKSKNIKRYLPHELKTREYAVKMYRNCGDIGFVCRKYHISRTSLWRWNKKYDGKSESLADKSHRPHSKHPTEHTDEEMKWIKDLIRRNPNITLNEIWYKLKINKGYTRKPTSLYRILRKIGYYNKPEIKGTSKKHDKEYHTPNKIGEKWQIDVKYVPNECKTEDIPKDKRFYQYTCIDEASRERYLYWYEEHSATNTVDFIKRCIRYYGYKTKEIQTDNGAEFTYNKADIKKEHPMEKLLKELEIRHHKIRPRTPEHNGKVERSHRNDNERFYSYLKFYSFEDLKKQGAEYLKRSNQIPMAVLGYLTPKEKRAELMCA